MKRLFWILLCLSVGVGVFAEQVAELSTATAYSVEQIEDEGSIGTLYEEFVFTYIPIIPPAPSEMFLQPIGRPIVFDESTFKRRFLSNLIGEMHPVSGAPVYTVFAMMDASNFDVVLFNENLFELARISRPKTYNPFSWAETKFGVDLTPELMALYNPARMIAEYKLIPIDYADYHIVALEQQAALEAATISMEPVESDGVSIRMAAVPATTVLAESEEPLMAMALSAPPPPGGGTNSPPAGSGGGSSNLVMELAITMPLDCGPYVEIFQKQNLIYPQLWDVAVNKMAVTGGVETIWADPVSSNAATMFYIVGDTSAGFDDGDGYSELRERHVENSNPFVFDMRDVDGDGLHDWFEIMNFGGSITNQSGTDDFDGDSLANNVEMVLHPAAGTNSAYITFSSDPSLYDTDGDGTDDGTEVAQGSDPSDPSDNGQPPATTNVTLYVQDRSPDYLSGGYTMKLSDGNNTYEISSSGQEAVSNTFDVVSGRSYTLTLSSEDFLPYTGAYTATVSGNGLVIDDPENILGVHDDNNTVVDLYPPGKAAAVHVVKIKTQTVATAPADRTRKTIGVGEKVDLTFLPAGLSPISWARSGAGDLDKTTGISVKFTASDVATNSTITATYDGHDFPVVFTTIEPSGVLFENMEGEDVGGASTPPGGISSWLGFSYSADVYVQPASVSFYNIELYESAAQTVATGYFATNSVPDHEANGPTPVHGGFDDDKGSMLGVDVWETQRGDSISGGVYPPFVNGTATWNTIWSYSVAGGDQHDIQTVSQQYILEGQGTNATFTIQKGGSGYFINNTDGEVVPLN